MARTSITVRIDVTIDGYEDVHPDLILEDALAVAERGWPDGFAFVIVDGPVEKGGVDAS